MITRTLRSTRLGSSTILLRVSAPSRQLTRLARQATLGKSCQPRAIVPRCAALGASPARTMSTVSDEDAAASSVATAPSLIAQRYKLTGEVIASKVFWAGFGWQGTSIIAEKMSMTADSAAFALTTGAGEALAVLAGHSAFYCLLKTSADKRADIATGLWLGTGTFCSGTAWQLIVNLLCSVTDSFPLVGAGTMAVCGASFYAGLRLGRALWGETLGLPVAKRDYENLCSDAGLSIAIGGATGMFVACDPALAMNVFSPFFGVLDTDSNLIGMIRAGAATSTGYGLVQIVQNFFPKGRNWMDLYLK